MVNFRIILFVSILSVILFGYFALFALAAEAPKFNIFTPYTHTQTPNQDYYLLDVRNESKNTEFNDPINADAGDVLVLSVYYHNGVNGTTAQNTKIKIVIPTDSGTQLIPKAYLWADNAENATASNPLSETATINVPAPSKLQFISGSVAWYPNQRDWRADSPLPPLSGQSGDEIIFGGLNIGDIVGCWEYSGYVNFKVRVVAAGEVLGAVTGTTSTTTPTGQVAGVSAVAGADNMLIPKLIASLAVSILGLIVIYLIMINFGYFTRLRLNMNVLRIKTKEKMSSWI